MLRLKQAQLGPPGVANGAATNVRGVFITDLHSDHIADWPMLHSTGVFNTAARPAPPENRGTLPRLFPPNRPEPPLINPANPTPGITETTDYLRQAHASDFNDRARDTAFTADALLNMHDIDLSGVWPVDRKAFRLDLLRSVGDEARLMLVFRSRLEICSAGRRRIGRAGRQCRTGRRVDWL